MFQTRPSTVLSEGIRRRPHRSGFSDSYQGCYLPNAKRCQTATLESDFGPHMAGSVSDTSLTPLSFQSPQTLEHRHDRSLPASHVNSSKNSRQTCTMNCYGGPIIHQRTKVRRSAPPSYHVKRLITSLMRLVPFLPVRDDFHPKRNQARQKLATLPASRFKDLSSDVFYELSRRYPEFKEQVCLLLRISIVSSHKTLRLVSKTNPMMNTHHRSTQVHQTLPQYHH